jgi:tRNA(fMet)-specific endonuclease VapC
MTQRQYLLDTNVLLHLVRGKVLGTAIEARFQLKAQANKPLLCVVTYGEIWAIARRNQWGDEKRRVLQAAIDELVMVSIADDDVVGAYVDIQLFTEKQGRPMGQNDLWIAAASKAAGAHLLACDKDFDHLYGKQIDGEYIDQQAILNGGKGGGQSANGGGKAT